MRLLIRRALIAFVLVTGLPLLSAAHAATEHNDVLVFGGTGQLGSEIVKALVEAGNSVTVFVRPNSDLRRLDGIAVSTLQGDVLNEDDVASALKTAKPKIVVDALARGKAGVEFYDVSERNISKWAKTTGVIQVILHSSVGAGRSRAVYPEANWPRMKDTLMAKEVGENHLIASGVSYTIIRNAILPPYGTPATGKAKLYEDETKYGPVTRADLARLTVECVGHSACFNKIYHAVDDTLPIPQRRQ